MREAGKLVGVISGSDIARAAAEGRLTKRTYVFDRDKDFTEWDRNAPD